MILWEFFREGGPIMWLLLACSFVGFGLFFERVLFWFQERRRLDLNEIDSFFKAIHNKEFEHAGEIAETANSKLLNDLAKTWETSGTQAMVEAFDLSINRIEKRSKKYLYALKTIVSASPLLGILGTVIGIIQSFNVLGSAGAAANPQAVGAGLAEALITTAFGLLIAVPCLIIHNYFLAKSRNYIGKLDEYAEELVFHLNEHDHTELESADPNHTGQELGNRSAEEEIYHETPTK